MFAVLVRVLPWMVFGVGTGVWGAPVGTALAAAACLVVIVSMRIRRNPWLTMILDVAGLSYFTAYAALLVSVSDPAVGDYVAAGSQLFLGVVVGAFLLAGIPFTEPIALASMDAEERAVAGADPRFHRFCGLLSAIWLLSFLIGGTILLALTVTGNDSTWITIVVIVAALATPTAIQERMIAAVTRDPSIRT